MNALGRRHSRLSFWREADQGIHSLEEAAEQVDVHALKFVFLTRSWSLKIVWVFLFLGGIAASCYYTRDIVEQFMAHKTATKVSTRILEKYDYPPIYVCPRYNWDLEKAAEYNLSREALIAAALLSQKNESHRPFQPVQLRSPGEEELHTFIQQSTQIKSKTYAAFYKWIAPDSRKIITGASAGIKSKDFDKVFVATPLHAHSPISYRACFNVSAEKYNPHSGELFYLEYDIAKYAPEPTPFGFDNEFAFIKDDHRVVLEKDRIYLRSNRITVIRLKMTEISRRYTKEDKCRVADGKPYSQEYCRHTCFVEAVERCSDCEVMTEQTKLIGGRLMCAWMSHPNLTVQCGEGYEEEQTAYETCISQRCLPLCDYKNYDYSTMQIVINSNVYNDTRLGLMIYFLVDDGIFRYEEIPMYDFSSMVSNVGGILGLWTGASILTVIEVCYLLLQFCCANWQIRKEERKRRYESMRLARETKTNESNLGKLIEYEQAPTSDAENEDATKNASPQADKQDAEKNEENAVPLVSILKTPRVTLEQRDNRDTRSI